MTFQREVVSVVAILMCASASSAATIDFGSSFSGLPYTEDGLTFTNLPGTSPAVVGATGGDGQLVAGTNVTPIHVRVSGLQPFNLISLDVEQISRTWRIESSLGAVVDLPGVGVVDIGTDSGWTNISYFDIVHDPGEANGSIRVDDIQFAVVPEPSCGGLLGGLFVFSLLGCRQPARHCPS